MQILIMATTERGENALRIHIKEYFSIGRAKRMALERLWRQRVKVEQPFTLEMESALRTLDGLLDPEYFIEKTIKPIMLANGATINTDYTVEIVRR